MDQQTTQQLNQGDISELLKKISESRATKEEKIIVLKKLSASLKEFGKLLSSLKQSMAEDK